MDHTHAYLSCFIKNVRYIRSQNAFNIIIETALPQGSFNFLCLTMNDSLKLHTHIINVCRRISRSNTYTNYFI